MFALSDGVNQIPASEANKLVDKTVPIPNDEDNYIVTLEVFHQLHCLVSYTLISRIKPSKLLLLEPPSQVALSRSLPVNAT